MKWKGLTDEQYNVFDIIIKTISGIFVICVFFIGLKQFTIQNEVENKRIFYDKQIEYIDDLVSVTANLAKPYLMNKDSLINKENKDSLIYKFKSLYYGKLQFYIGDTSFIKTVTEFNRITYFIEKGEQDYGGRPTVEVSQEYSIKIGNQAKAIIDKLYEIKI